MIKTLKKNRNFYVCCNYEKLVGLPYPALLGIFIVSSVSTSLCFYVSLSLSLPSISPKPNLTLNPIHPSLSLTPPPLLFPDKKFPVEAHFWLDELFYYIEDWVCCLLRTNFSSKKKAPKKTRFRSKIFRLGLKGSENMVCHFL